MIACKICVHDYISGCYMPQHWAKRKAEAVQWLKSRWNYRLLERIVGTYQLSFKSSDWLYMLYVAIQAMPLRARDRSQCIIAILALL